MKVTTPHCLMLALSGCVFIATSAGAQNLSDRIDHVMQQRTRAEANNRSKSHMLSTLLYTDISVQFQETPARDAINYLQTVLGINLVGRYSDDRVGVGIDPEETVTLNVTDQPAITVLEMVLAQLETDEDMAWQLRDGYVEVGTKERLSAANAREIRYYPIKDLLFEAPRFDNAPDIDLDSALDQGGNQGGGGGSGGGGGGGGGGGFGGGGGGGSGGGGNIFGESGEDPVRVTETEKAQEIIDLIVEIVEPDAWDINGGEWASIRYYQGTLIVRAPDYIHRQISGYPFAIRPVGNRSVHAGQRYVMFTTGLSNVEIAGIRVTPPFEGAAGGSGGVGDKADGKAKPGSGAPSRPVPPKSPAPPRGGSKP